MAVVLRDDGWVVNRKRAQRLMRLMGLEAIYQKPNTSRPHPDHKVCQPKIEMSPRSPTWKCPLVAEETGTGF
jgi:hypothetical protein